MLILLLKLILSVSPSGIKNPVWVLNKYRVKNINKQVPVKNFQNIVILSQ